ncbi:conserved hypothetical protein [Xanthomonas citri pv. fuscans]|nr:conserved hypothetical protein [Xanthomonas citri pv. fuscans]SOO00075.1 conserved hypothetical protein [Xanthomonas citri pv. fuscans]SOO05970.1 conserved hypothetical protein [Xanthomonas citri pv. fuscans]SOO08314.1 conserved hypothetical protein [Xanthomonas citri pv. fuscans]SOO14416.1 conserved hypothetical protein [Xanthomonas citri pv. fuscans]
MRAARRGRCAGPGRLQDRQCRVRLRARASVLARVHRAHLYRARPGNASGPPRNSDDFGPARADAFLQRARWAVRQHPVPPTRRLSSGSHLVRAWPSWRQDRGRLAPVLGIVARQVAAACADQLPAPQVECGADLKGSMRGDMAIDLGHARPRRNRVRSLACMLQAIYASASLHVQLASHYVLQKLRDISKAMQAAPRPWRCLPLVERGKSRATLSLAHFNLQVTQAAAGEKFVTRTGGTPTTCAPACRMERLRPLRPATDVDLP